MAATFNEKWINNFKHRLPIPIFADLKLLTFGRPKCDFKNWSKFSCFLHCCSTGSPFNVGVQNEVNPKKVKCYGPGLEPSEVKAFAPATFTVDATEAGEAPLDVKVTDSMGEWAALCFVKKKRASL